MNPVQDLVNFTIDAIVASGKKFDNIQKESIIHFLQNTQKLSTKEAEKIYKKVSDSLSGKISQKINAHESQVTSVYQEIPLKEKTPRKSVFSEIKKITK